MNVRPHWYKESPTIALHLFSIYFHPHSLEPNICLLVAYMRTPYRPSRRADAGMRILRVSTGMSSLSAGAGMSLLRAGAGMGPLLAGAGMSSPRASNWQPLEYKETLVWP